MPEILAHVLINEGCCDRGKNSMRLRKCAGGLVVGMRPLSLPHSIHHAFHGTTSWAWLMAPYDFEAPDADVILRCSDGKELRIHSLILSLASPIFQGMFSLPQPTQPPRSQTPTIDVPETSDILEPLIQYLYPRSQPKVSDLAMWEALYTAADKYNTEAVMETLRDMLISRFLETSPMRVYALASHWGFEEEAKVASRGTLTLDLSGGFPEEDAKLMGSVACQKLYLLHLQRRDKARALVSSSHYHQFLGVALLNCTCPPMDFHTLILVLSQRVSTRPWLTAEDLYEEAVRTRSQRMCADSCRNAYKNIHAWFSSILEDLSQLPQTI